MANFKPILDRALQRKNGEQGRLQYDDNTVTWKKDTKSPARVYKREDMQEGAKNLPWEDEAYKNS